MSTAARTYWIAVAHQHRGDRAAAAVAYGKARARSRGRPRDLIDQALAGLAETKRAELAQVASEVVARVEAAPLPPRVRIARPPRLRSTWLLAAAVVGASLTVAIAIGDTADAGVLVRAGALARGLVDAGEWWRMVSCLFVHAGTGHLLVNALGLVVLGLLVEDIFGAARMTAIFAVSGLAGALASYLASPVGLSAGASGAVLGLLGALFVEITWHREHYAAAWKRGLWGALIVIAVSQLGFGALSDVFDQWAHGGGLVAGAALGAALSPTARWRRPGAIAARAIAIGFAALVVVAAIATARTSLADSLAREPTVRRELDRVAIRVPAGWYASTRLVIDDGRPRLLGDVLQPDALVGVTLQRLARLRPGELVQRWADEQIRQTAGKPDEHALAAHALLALPAGWEARELTTVHADGMGYDQRGRTVVCAKAFGDQTVLAVIELPETIAAAAAEFVAQLLASIEPV